MDDVALVPHRPPLHRLHEVQSEALGVPRILAVLRKKTWNIYYALDDFEISLTLP